MGIALLLGALKGSKSEVDRLWNAPILGIEPDLGSEGEVNLSDLNELDETLLWIVGGLLLKDLTNLFSSWRRSLVDIPLAAL